MFNKKLLFLILTFILVSLILSLILNKNKPNYSSIIPLINNSDSMYNTTPQNFKTIRPPAVAGQFYPAQPDELNAMLDKFLKAAQVPQYAGQPQIFIVPHAGYVFSGPTAAYAFKTLQGYNYDNVILLGPSHHYPTDKLTLYAGDAVNTPLGNITVNKTIVHELATTSEIKINNNIHAPEHSLEVQIPFLQKVLGSHWQIVLGLINNQNFETLKNTAHLIYNTLQKHPHTLIVISSDLSHYPKYKDALDSDHRIMDAILTKDPTLFSAVNLQILSENKPGLDTCACGANAIKIGMFLAQQLNLTGYQLHYSNSGDTPLYGDKSHVVGYGAIIFTSKQPQPTANNSQNSLAAQSKLSEQEQLIALKLARHTLKQLFKNTKQGYKNYKNYPIFSEPRGVFVTLYTKNTHRLRGCIGLIEPIKPLAEAIIDMAQAAAFHDSRFSPLTEPELNNIKIEISVLTPPQLIKDIHQIQLGQHGVIVRRDNHSGVYLPQVATETGWDLNTFLSNLCVSKASLEADCWQNPSTQIYTFTAQVFEEK